MYPGAGERQHRGSQSGGLKTILASCPHCVKTIGNDYRKFGYEVEIVHSSVFVEELTRDRAAASQAARDRSPTTTLLSRTL